MKKRMIAILIMAALCTGCGQKENSAESYNEKPDKDEVAVNAAGMWDVETSYGSIQDLMSEAECVVYAEVKKLEYTVEDGSVSTDETVQVIDNLYGDVNKGEEINIFKMGGYAKIKDYIDSYEEEYREQARNFAGFNNLTEKDIETAKEFLNANFDSIAHKIYPMAMKVKEYGYSTPLQSAKSILYIIDTFNLWDIEIFNFGDKKIKTHKACLKFMEEN